MLNLSIENINKSFKNELVLDNICLTLNAGDIVLLKGKNGSGKSTLLKILCDILIPDNGNIKYSSKKMSSLIENPGFIENEDLSYNLRKLSGYKYYNENKALELCEQFNLVYKDRINLKNYSLGMRQKVGIIQSLLYDYDYLFLDEPIRGLDKKSIDIFINLMNEQSKNHITIIASHDPLDGINFTKKYEMIKGKLILINE